MTCKNNPVCTRQQKPKQSQPSVHHEFVPHISHQQPVYYKVYILAASSFLAETISSIAPWEGNGAVGSREDLGQTSAHAIATMFVALTPSLCQILRPSLSFDVRLCYSWEENPPYTQRCRSVIYLGVC